MELHPAFQASWPFYLLPPYSYYIRRNTSLPHNYVHWVETPESHLYSAELPGVRMEDVRVEVEDSRYLVIRTEYDHPNIERTNFMRKFRLPDLIDLSRISASLRDGVLRITVPRTTRREALMTEVVELAEELNGNVVARAA